MNIYIYTYIWVYIHSEEQSHSHIIQPGRGMQCSDTSQSLINGEKLRVGITCMLRIGIDCSNLSYFNSIVPFLFCNLSLFLRGFSPLFVSTPLFSRLPIQYCFNVFMTFFRISFSYLLLFSPLLVSSQSGDYSQSEQHLLFYSFTQ